MEGNGKTETLKSRLSLNKCTILLVPHIVGGTTINSQTYWSTDYCIRETPVIMSSGHLTRQ